MSRAINVLNHQKNKSRAQLMMSHVSYQKGMSQVVNIQN